MNANERETALHAELTKLPNRRAPATLVPRVLAALEARGARPWWQQPWMAWPRWCQAASAAFVAGILGMAWWAEPLAVDRAQSSLSPLSQQWSAATGWFQSSSGFFGLLPGGWMTELAVIAGLYLVCVGLATACVRVAGGQR